MNSALAQGRDRLYAADPLRWTLAKWALQRGIEHAFQGDIDGVVYWTQFAKELRSRISCAD